MSNMEKTMEINNNTELEVNNEELVEEEIHYKERNA